MPNTVLFDDGTHKNVMLEEFDVGPTAVQSNQHIIVHDGVGMILDPGGNRLYSQVMAATIEVLGSLDLRYIFLSHQDPDIIAALNGWLLTTDAEAYISNLWVRFVPHCWFDDYCADQLRGIPDEGMVLNLNGAELPVLAAHFLHSVGNFHVYDPISKILYTGDLGASLGVDYTVVPDFNQHLHYSEPFHKRYMASNQVLRAWVEMVRQLDVEMIVPQHGAVYQGKDMVNQFLDWCAGLKCGGDILTYLFQLPANWQPDTNTTTTQ